MTVNEVKRDLPDVPVTIGGKRYMARVTGRLNPAATVTLSYVSNAGPQEYLRGLPWVDFPFSWEAVALAITTDNPLDLN